MFEGMNGLSLLLCLMESDERNFKRLYLGIPLINDWDNILENQTSKFVNYVNGIVSSANRNTKSQNDVD